METVEDLDFLKDYKGRIWIIDSIDSSFYNDKFKTNDYKVIDSKVIKTKYPSSFDTNYSGYEYNLILIEK